MKWKFILVIILVVVPAMVFAQTLDDAVYVRPEETVPHNLVRLAERVTVQGKVVGDVIALAWGLEIGGTVSGDVLGAAEDVEIKGTVEGNARVVGESIELKGTIGKNVMAAGSRVVVAEGAVVEGSFNVFTETLEIRGEVKGPVHGRANRAVISGASGSVNLVMHGGSLLLTKTARINGDLAYQGSQALTQEPGAIVTGKITFDEAKTEGVSLPQLTSQFWWKRILRLFSLLAVAIICWAVAKRFFVLGAVYLQRRPLQSVGVGILVMLAVPAISLALLFTVIGIPLALILMIKLAVLLYVGQVTVSYALGQWLVAKLKRTESVSPYAELIIGTVIFIILGSLPWIGGILTWLGVFGGAGALAWLVREFLTFTPPPKKITAEPTS